MKLTDNYRLRLPEGYEQYDIGDHNYNYQTLDARLKAVADAGGADHPTAAGRTAALIVAPHDASEKNKQGADLVLDGQSDGPTLQAALDAVTKGEIVLCAGTVNLTTSGNGLTLNHSGVSLRGTGTTLLVGGNKTALTLKASDISVSGLTLTASGTSKGVLVSGVKCRLTDLTATGDFGTGCAFESVASETTMTRCAVTANCTTAFSARADRYRLTACTADVPKCAAILYGNNGTLVGCRFSATSTTTAQFGLVYLGGEGAWLHGCRLSAVKATNNTRAAVGIVLETGVGHRIEHSSFTQLQTGVQCHYAELLHGVSICDNGFEYADTAVDLSSFAIMWQCTICRNRVTETSRQNTQDMVFACYQIARCSIQDNHIDGQLSVLSVNINYDDYECGMNVITGNTSTGSIEITGLWRAQVAHCSTTNYYLAVSDSIITGLLGSGSVSGSGNIIY